MPSGSELAVLDDRGEVYLRGRAALSDSEEDELDVGEDAGQ